MCVMANPGKEKTQKETPERGNTTTKQGGIQGKKEGVTPKILAYFLCKNNM